MIKKTLKDLDKYYTKKGTARYCIDLIEDLNSYTKIIEPSAGNGSFSSQIENCLAYDIAPENDQIIKQDFFNLRVLKKENDKILTIGNPPFGKKAKLAIEFFNYASVYSDTIAFVVPIQFKKWSVQSKLDPTFFLETDIILPKNSFLVDGKEFSLNCCFQIWRKRHQLPVKDLRLKQKLPISHEDFELWQYNSTKEALKFFNKNIYKWDFAVHRQGYHDYTKKVYNESDLDPKYQWIFIKAKSKEVLDILMKIDYTLLSRSNTSTPGFGKADLIEGYKNECSKSGVTNDYRGQK